VKPLLVHNANGCGSCDGYGVMTLYGGPAQPEILAPCIECSQTKTLNECLLSREAAIKAHHLVEEKRAISEHNERIGAT